MRLDHLYLCPKDSEQLIQPDSEVDELVCQVCGTSFRNPEVKRLERLAESRQLTSPGMVNNNLGTDQRAAINELHRRGSFSRFRTYGTDILTKVSG